MKTKYTSDEIMKMAVGLIEADSEADLDRDGKVTSSDARLRDRVDEGLEKGSTATLMSSDILDRLIENTDSFSYDFNVDPLYQQYSRLYSDAAKRDAEDIFGLSATLTGGYGNSYGLTKAADVKKEYARELSEKAGELEQKAYDRYLDAKSEQYDIFKALRELEADSSKESSEEFDRALQTAKLGDLSALEKLGVDTSAIENKNKEELAAFFAKYKDYSLLKQLGIDTSVLEREDISSLAKLFASYGDYSLLEALGADASSQEALDEIDRLLKLSRLG